MGIMKLLGTSFSTILNGGNPTADRTVTFPDKDITVAGTNDVIGVGQTWQDVTGSRVSGTTYANTTGKPIMAIVEALGAAAASSATPTVGGVVLARTRIGVIAGNTNGAATTFIIPAGQTYSVSIEGTLGKWVELR